jgi:diacylglycerol kinase (ATP)
MPHFAAAAVHGKPYPSMDRTLIFANPISGRGGALAASRRLADHFEALGMNPLIILDRADRAAVPDLHEVRGAVSVGGDGTLHAVAHRLVAETALLGRNTVPFPLAIVGMGTANLMAQHTGNLWHPDRMEQEVAAALLAGPSRPLDVGTTDRGIFLIMVGVGFDGQIIHALDKLRSGPISHFTYLRPISESLANYTFPQIEVVIDGKTVFPMQSGLVFIGNAREYGTGFPLLIHAHSDDGLLDVLALPAKCRSDLWRLAMSMLTADHVRQEGVIYERGRQIEVHGERPVHVQVDGEAADFTPLTAGVLPVRIPFVSPVSDLHAHSAAFRRLFRTE